MCSTRVEYSNINNSYTRSSYRLNYNDPVTGNVYQLPERLINGELALSHKQAQTIIDTQYIGPTFMLSSSHNWYLAKQETNEVVRVYTPYHEEGLKVPIFSIFFKYIIRPYRIPFQQEITKETITASTPLPTGESSTDIVQLLNSMMDKYDTSSGYDDVHIYKNLYIKFRSLEDLKNDEYEIYYWTESCDESCDIDDGECSDHGSVDRIVLYNKYKGINNSLLENHMHIFGKKILATKITLSNTSYKSYGRIEFYIGDEYVNVDIDLLEQESKDLIFSLLDERSYRRMLTDLNFTFTKQLCKNIKKSMSVNSVVFNAHNINTIQKDLERVLNAASDVSDTITYTTSTSNGTVLF
jgi:hypothetical protein